MKQIILIILFTTSIFAQSSKMLLLMDDEYLPLTITANTSNYIIDDGGVTYFFRVAGIAGKTFKVDWGDGTISQITFIGATTDQRIAKTYTNAGTYNVKIYGWDYVTRLLWQNWNAGAFNLQKLPAGLTYLNLFSIGTNITGSISSLLTKLTYLRLHTLGTNITGSISSLPAELTDLYLINIGNNIDITTGTMPAWGSTAIIIAPQSGYGYKTAQIDGFLNAWALTAASGTRTINLTGANQPRSSASDAAVTILTGLGKTILTNP